MRSAHVNDQHTVFDFGGEANAKSLDLSAAAAEALREANDELARTHDTLREMAAQMAGMERDRNAWRALAYGFAAVATVLVIAVMVVVVMG